MDRVEKWAFGNGSPGADELLRNLNEKVDRIAATVGMTQSDLRHVMNFFRQEYGTNFDFTENEKDRKANSDKFLEWLGDKVAPALLIAVIYYVTSKLVGGG